jgi:uncharacterized protein (DUF433 family)
MGNKPTGPLEGARTATTTAMKTLAGDPRASIPLYTVTDAAFYLAIPESTLYRWIYPDDQVLALVSSLRRKGREPFIPFIGLAEAFILAAARKEELTSRAIREGVEAIKIEYGIAHALAYRMIYLDKVNREVGIRHNAAHHERARDRQIQFIDAVAPYLVWVDFGSDDFARRLTLPRFDVRVTTSPTIAGGDPIVQKTGARLRDILSLERAGVSEDEIAYESGLSPNEVQSLIADAAKGKTS